MSKTYEKQSSSTTTSSQDHANRSKQLLNSIINKGHLQSQTIFQPVKDNKQGTLNKIEIQQPQNQLNDKSSSSLRSRNDQKVEIYKTQNSGVDTYKDPLHIFSSSTSSKTGEYNTSILLNNQFPSIPQTVPSSLPQPSQQQVLTPSFTASSTPIYTFPHAFYVHQPIFPFYYQTSAPHSLPTSQQFMCQVSPQQYAINQEQMYGRNISNGDFSRKSSNQSDTKTTPYEIENVLKSSPPSTQYINYAQGYNEAMQLYQQQQQQMCSQGEGGVQNQKERMLTNSNNNNNDDNMNEVLNDLNIYFEKNNKCQKQSQVKEEVVDCYKESINNFQQYDERANVKSACGEFEKNLTQQNLILKAESLSSIDFVGSKIENSGGSVFLDQSFSVSQSTKSLNKYNINNENEKNYNFQNNNLKQINYSSSIVPNNQQQEATVVGVGIKVFDITQKSETKQEKQRDDLPISILEYQEYLNTTSNGIKSNNNLESENAFKVCRPQSCQQQQQQLQTQNSKNIATTTAITHSSPHQSMDSSLLSSSMACQCTTCLQAQMVYLQQLLIQQQQLYQQQLRSLEGVPGLDTYLFNQQSQQQLYSNNLTSSCKSNNSKDCRGSDQNSKLHCSQQQTQVKSTSLESQCYPSSENEQSSQFNGQTISTNSSCQLKEKELSLLQQNQTQQNNSQQQAVHSDNNQVLLQNWNCKKEYIELPLVEIPEMKESFYDEQSRVSRALLDNIKNITFQQNSAKKKSNSITQMPSTLFMPSSILDDNKMAASSSIISKQLISPHQISIQLHSDNSTPSNNRLIDMLSNNSDPYLQNNKSSPISIVSNAQVESATTTYQMPEYHLLNQNQYHHLSITPEQKSTIINHQRSTSLASKTIFNTSNLKRKEELEISQTPPLTIRKTMNIIELEEEDNNINKANNHHLSLRNQLEQQQNQIVKQLQFQRKHSAQQSKFQQKNQNISQNNHKRLFSEVPLENYLNKQQKQEHKQSQQQVHHMSSKSEISSLTLTKPKPLFEINKFSKKMYREDTNLGVNSNYSKEKNIINSSNSNNSSGGNSQQKQRQSRQSRRSYSFSGSSNQSSNQSCNKVSNNNKQYQINKTNKIINYILDNDPYLQQHTSSSVRKSRRKNIYDSQNYNNMSGCVGGLIEEQKEESIAATQKTMDNIFISLDEELLKSSSKRSDQHQSRGTATFGIHDSLENSFHKLFDQEVKSIQQQNKGSQQLQQQKLQQQTISKQQKQEQSHQQKQRSYSIESSNRSCYKSQQSNSQKSKQRSSVDPNSLTQSGRQFEKYKPINDIKCKEKLKQQKILLNEEYFGNRFYQTSIGNNYNKSISKVRSLGIEVKRQSRYQRSVSSKTEKKKINLSAIKVRKEKEQQNKQKKEEQKVKKLTHFKTASFQVEKNKNNLLSQKSKLYNYQRNANQNKQTIKSQSKRNKFEKTLFEMTELLSKKKQPISSSISVKQRNNSSSCQRKQVNSTQSKQKSVKNEQYNQQSLNLEGLNEKKSIINSQRVKSPYSIDNPINKLKQHHSLTKQRINKSKQKSKDEESNVEKQIEESSDQKAPTNVQILQSEQIEANEQSNSKSITPPNRKRKSLLKPPVYKEANQQVKQNNEQVNEKQIERKENQIKEKLNLQKLQMEFNTFKEQQQHIGKTEESVQNLINIEIQPIVEAQVIANETVENQQQQQQCQEGLKQQNKVNCGESNQNNFATSKNCQVTNQEFSQLLQFLNFSHSNNKSRCSQQLNSQNSNQFSNASRGGGGEALGNLTLNNTNNNSRNVIQIKTEKSDNSFLSKEFDQLSEQKKSLLFGQSQNYQRNILGSGQYQQSNQYVSQQKTSLQAFADKAQNNQGKQFYQEQMQEDRICNNRRSRKVNDQIVQKDNICLPNSLFFILKKQQQEQQLEQKQRMSKKRNFQDNESGIGGAEFFHKSILEFSPAFQTFQGKVPSNLATDQSLCFYQESSELVSFAKITDQNQNTTNSKRLSNISQQQKEVLMENRQRNSIDSKFSSTQQHQNNQTQQQTSTKKKQKQRNTLNLGDEDKKNLRERISFHKIYNLQQQQKQHSITLNECNINNNQQ